MKKIELPARKPVLFNMPSQRGEYYLVLTLVTLTFYFTRECFYFNAERGIYENSLDVEEPLTEYS